MPVRVGEARHHRRAADIDHARAGVPLTERIEWRDRGGLSVNDIYAVAALWRLISSSEHHRGTVDELVWRTRVLHRARRAGDEG